ncbi:lysostaphin resistance A-like protein [Acidobacteriota bacterium]
MDSSSEMKSFLSLLVFFFGYSSYFFISHSKTIQKRLCLESEDGRRTFSWIAFQRFTGVVFLGFFPGILVWAFPFWRFSELGLGLNLSKIGLLWTSGIGICVLFVSYFSSRKPENFKSYPQVRENPWTMKTVLFNTGSWLVYLVAYEFLFRGLLLFTFSSALGLWPAIVITTCLYTLVHIPKGLKEAIGALPFGVVLGLITIEADSIWPAVFIHAVLALSYDHFSLRANPEMHYDFFKKQSQ